MKPKFAFIQVRASRRHLVRNLLLTSSIVVAFSPTPSNAEDKYWDRGAGTNIWATNTNWSTDPTLSLDPAAAPGIADLAIFNTTALITAQTIELNAAQSALGLRSDSSGTVTLLGNGANRVLTLGASGILKTGTGAFTVGSGTANINVSLALSADQTWANNNNTGAITIVNGVAASAAENRILTLGGTSTAANTISGIIANNGVGVLTLNKSDAGTWVLSGANTYTGVTTISGGILTVQNNAALGTNAGGTVIQSGGTLNLGGTMGNNTLSLGTEAITVSGTGAGNLGAIVNTGSNGQQSAIQGVVTMVADTTFGGSQRWDIRNGTLNGGGFNLTKIGTNSVFLSGTAQIGTSLGQLAVREGEFVMETGALATTGNITGGVLIAPTTAVTATFRSWGNYVDHTANFTLDSSLIANATARISVDNGYTTHSGTITAIGTQNHLVATASGVMTNTGILAGTGALSKEGDGVLLVNGTSNTHSGVFNLNVGFLGGTGTLTSSALNINNGGRLSPGLMNQAGTFNVSNAIVSSGANTALFHLGTTSDLVNVGTLTQDGTTNISVIPGTGFAPGTYTLYDYGTLNGTTGFAGFKLNHVDGALIDTGSEIKLQLNSTNVPTWSGVSNGIWRAGSLTNPILPNFAFAPAPGGQVEFVTNDAVLFDDSAVGTTNIVTDGTIAPAVTRFNNATKAYTVNGTISGAGQIIKDGSGTVTLLSTPTTLGGLDINAGTLQLGNESFSAGYTVGPIDIAAGATLAVMAGNGSAAAQLGTTGTAATGGGTPITGSGTILLNSAVKDIYHNFAADRGQVEIRGDLTGFTGNIVVNDGNRLAAITATSLGNAAGITVNNGGGLYVSSAALNYAGPITVSGLGWQETTGSLGAIRLQGGTLSGPITLADDTRITAYNTGPGTLSGPISGGASTDLEFGMRFSNSGTLNVTNTTSSYGGSTSIHRMTINAASIANSGSASSLGSGSVINMQLGNLVITGPGAMTTNRTINLNQDGQGGSTIGVSTPGAVVTFTGAFNNGNANFPISTLDFRQTLSADGTTGGTIVLDTASPIRTSGTNIHRTNLTLAGNTSFTVDFATTGTAAAPIGQPGDFKIGFNTTAANSGPITLTIQDNATLNTYGRFDVANEGQAITTTVNQTGGVVNAMRGGASFWVATDGQSNNAMRIGHWTSSTGIYNLTGGTLNVPNGYVDLAHNGNGTLNQTTGSTANLRGLRLGNSNTVTGIYNLDGGTLNIGDLGIVRGGTSTTHQINLNGGTLGASASFAIGSDLPIYVQSGGGTINTNGFNVNSASALLAGTTAGGILTKTGLGEFNVPSGLNTMDGTININGGSFGGAGEFTAATVNVNNGGTLAGTVNVSNTTSGTGVLVASGGTISPGTNGGADNGTVTASAVAFNTGSKIEVSGAFGDSLNVVGALSGTTVISVVPNGLLFGGTTPLVTYGSSTLAFTATLPHLVGATVTNNIGTSTIELNYTSQETLTWTGTGGAVWDASTANTWNASTSGAVNYLQGDVVEFKDSSAVGTIAVQGTGVTPANVLFDNSATAYTLTGGGIGGGGSLTKSGTATVILATNNSYSGTTTITGGTLQIGNGGTSGTLGLGATTNDGILSFNRSDSSLYLGTISGSGIVRSDGTGTTTLGGANSYSGGTIISKGILVGRTATSFGSGLITLNDASTGSANTGFSINPFNVDPAITVTNNILVKNLGTGTVSIGSSEQSNRLQGLIFTGTLTLEKDVTIYGEADRTSFAGTSTAQTAPVITGTADKITIARSPNLVAGLVGRVTWDQNNLITPLTPGGVTTIEIQDGANLQMGINTASIGAKDQIPDTATVNVMAGGTFSFATTGDGEVIGNLTGAGTVRSVLNSGMLLTFGTATDATFSGVINGGNSLSFRKQGTGTATWSGILDNPSGNIDVTAGTMVFAKASTPFVHAIGGNSTINSAGTLKLGGTYTDTRPADEGRNTQSTAPLNFPANYVDQIYNNVNLTVNGTLDMNDRSEVITGLTGTTGKVTNSVAGSVSTLYLGRNNGDFSFTGLLEDGTGKLNIEKTGTGTQTLGGNNTYTGTTTIYGGGRITMTNVNALGSTSGATILQCSRDGQYASLNITLAASTPAAPNIVAEPFAMYSETEANQRTEIVNTAESTRLTGNITLYGDGINQILASQAAGDQLQVNSSITGPSDGILFLRGTGEMQLNGTINAPNLQVAKTDTGLLILNSTGNNYGEASFVHGTVRTDVADALDPTAVLRMGQSNNSNTLDLNGFDQTVAGIRLNAFTDNTTPSTRTITSLTGPATLTVNTPTADGGDYDYAGLIAGPLSLAKSGPGSQVLSGSNTYSGITNVTGGSLYVNGTHSGGGDYTVGSGATLGGEGTISPFGNVTFAAGSNLRVGNTTDAGGGDDLSFSVTDFTLSSSTTLSLDLWANLHLAGQTAGADQGESDVLEVYASTINLAGILNVANPANISSWMVGDTFDLFDWFTTPTGTFNTVNLPTLTAGLAWDTSKLYLSEGTDGDLAGTIKVASSGGLTPIETWRQTHFGSPANTGNGADGADPDKDGVPNVMEYALGMIPTTPTTVGLPTYTTVGGSGKISFNRSLTATDVTYVVQASNNLTAWTDLATRTSGSGTWSPVAGGVLVTDPGSGSVSVTDNVTVAGQSKRFMRLVAINPLP